MAENQAQNVKQQTESQFYNMLNLQQQVIQGFDLHRLVPNSQHTIQGRDCFRDWRNNLYNRHSELAEKHDYKCSMERAIEAYQKVLKKHQGDLGLYFRSLYSVFRFIESSDSNDKKSFALVVRSLLSDYELVILFYNCLSLRGQKFKRFAINYALFDNLDIELLVATEHVLFMEKESYGDNEEALSLFP